MEIDKHVSTRDQKVANEHMSNERTFLAWLSASLAIMAFGFVVVKFALFAKQFGPLLDLTLVKANDYSSALGIALVFIGAMAILLSWKRFLNTRKRLRSGNFVHSATSLTLLAACIFFVSLMLVAYLAFAGLNP